jgi:hypothetical protein
MRSGAAWAVSLLLALVALSVALVVVGCGSTATVPSAPPAVSSAPPAGSPTLLSPSATPALWSVAASFADYRSAVTQPFTLSGGEQLFRVWFEEGRLTVAVVSADDRSRIIKTLRYSQAGEAESALRLPAGDYVLDVESTGAWAIEVRER